MKQITVLISFWEENYLKEKEIQIEIPEEIPLTEENVYSHLGNWLWFSPDILDFWVK